MSLCPHLAHFHLCLLLCFFFIHLNSFYSNIYRLSTNLLLLWLLFALFFRSAPRSPRSSDNQANQRKRICAVSVALALFTSLVRLQFLKHMHPETHTHTHTHSERSVWPGVNFPESVRHQHQSVADPVQVKREDSGGGVRGMKMINVL